MQAEGGALVNSPTLFASGNYRQLGTCSNASAVLRQEHLSTPIYYLDPQSGRPPTGRDEKTVEEMVEVRPCPAPSKGKADLLRTSTQWAAGDSNPAHGLKGTWYLCWPMPPCARSCLSVREWGWLRAGLSGPVMARLATCGRSFARRSRKVG